MLSLLAARSLPEYGAKHALSLGKGVASKAGDSMRARQVCSLSFGFRRTQSVYKFAGAAAILALALAANAQEELSGPAQVINGDTIVFGRVYVRLYGIDAPEMEQLCRDGQRKLYDCGGIAADELRRLIAGQSLTCQRKAIKQKDQIAAVCSVGKLDLGREMVRQGWAFAYFHYSHAYDGDQHEAKARRRGMWAGTFEWPWRWRQDHQGHYQDGGNVR